MSELVILLSQYDTEAALRFSSSLPLPELSIDIQSEQLEEREIPRINRHEKTLKPQVTIEEKKRKGLSLTQLLKRKTKRREKYLLKLQTVGKYDPTRPVKPDPERWIPKNQRSYAKRGRKNRGKFVGGQGSGDGAQKDMIKLDAYARAQLKKEEEAKLEETRLKEALEGRKPPPGKKGRKKR
eukprot:CAMPEP_0182431562 /NCGR_PEP_ID=MMETSP1167-20130531/50158_1 /TAXON_ID=2988 /ORGANISM="Mallomonas Sp, Strain CCMP3275" /LENGTH=181 /DNA_ID=CAMNT_0024618043 /DNA_START=131 /DNA_END=676 /DNA_ORIENTATION=+